MIQSDSTTAINTGDIVRLKKGIKVPHVHAPKFNGLMVVIGANHDGYPYVTLKNGYSYMVDDLTLVGHGF